MANMLPGVVHTSTPSETMLALEAAFASARPAKKKANSPGKPVVRHASISLKQMSEINAFLAAENEKASAPETVAPDQRWQRGVEAEEAYLAPKAPRRTQRVYNGVRQLHADGRISDAHLAAANRWVSDFEWCYTSSYVDPHTAGIRSSNTGPENRLNGGLDSQTRYMQSCRAVGVTGDMLLRAFVSQGKSLRALEREVGVTRKRLSDMLVETLETLAQHYDEVNRWGRNGILEPRKVPDDTPLAQPSTMAA